VTWEHSRFCGIHTDGICTCKEDDTLGNVEFGLDFADNIANGGPVVVVELHGVNEEEGDDA
jgi:hypothetical protein